MKQPFHLKTRKIVKFWSLSLTISYHNSRITPCIILLAKHELEVAILNLVLDQILQFIFYIVLAILEFLPRIFPFWWKKGVWRSTTKIAHSNCNYGIYWSHRERGEQKQISFQSLIHDWAKLFMKSHLSKDIRYIDF